MTHYIIHCLGLWLFGFVSSLLVICPLTLLHRVRSFFAAGSEITS